METKTYKAAQTTRYKTRKVHRVMRMAEATEHHAEQTHLYTEDERIGEWKEDRWSGAITLADKVDMLKRCDELIRATKKARSVANETKVEDRRIACALWQHITGEMRG
jgi:hypothetical protein